MCLTDILGQIPGPHFLVLYIVVIAASYFGLKLILRSYDKSLEEDSPRIPVEPDPYVIAFIRKGPREVLKVILFSLIERQYVIVNSAKDSVKVHKKHPPEENLTNLEKFVYSGLSKSFPIATFLDSPYNQKQVEDVIMTSDFLRKNSDIVLSHDYMDKFKNIKSLLIAVVVILGGYKLFYAIAHGHFNVVFLIGAGVVGVIVLAKTKFSKSACKRNLIKSEM